MGSINGILNDVLTRFYKLCSGYLPVIVWAGLIFLLSAQSNLPGFDVVLYDYLFKKASHIFVYAVLYALIFRAINYDRTLPAANWQLPFLLTLAYAIVDEFHQVFTPNRHPSPLDVGFDMLGASISFLRIYRYI